MKLVTRIWERWYSFFGHTLYVRLEPKEFKEDVKTISNLIDDEDFNEAHRAVEAAYRRWGSDPEIIRLDSIRLDSFGSFMRDEVSDLPHKTSCEKEN
jgi:hypothetical protein